MKKIEGRNQSAGFTMVEVVVALAVVAILGAIAYPSFKERLISGRRADGTTALLNLANRMEQYNAQNNTYATATIAQSVPATDVLTSAASPQGFYTLSIPPLTLTANSYTIKATRAGSQTADTQCGDLTFTSAGVKGVTGTYPVSRCW